MPLLTRPHFSDKQIVQFSDEAITLSGETNFIGVLKSKNIEIDATVSNPLSQDGFVLKYDETTNKIILLPDDSGVAGLTNAVNGLGSIGNTVFLGGTLLSGTTININGFPFVITGGTFSLQDLEIKGIGLDTTPVNSAQNLYLKYNSGTNKFEPAELIVPDTVLAENGLTKINNVVSLGGELNQATTINQLGFPLIFTGGTVGVQRLEVQGVEIDTTPVNNTQSLFLKYNSSQTKFEPSVIDYTDIENTPPPSQLSASNGLSITGDTVQLGGSLVKDTEIALQQNSLKFNVDAVVGVIDYTIGFNNETRTISVQSDGKIIIGGNFTSYNGTPINRIIRLNTDGTIDNTFNVGTGFNSVVYAIDIQSDGKIIIGGFFILYNGTPRNRIIRLNTDGTIDNTFNVGTGFNSIVYAIDIQSDGKIIIGGDFTSYNGTAINRIIRLNTDGTIDNTFNLGTGFNSIVFAIDIQSDGKIIIGGFFTSYNGTPRNRIIRLNTDGTIDNTFNVGTGFSLTVFAIDIQSDGKLIIGGDFTSYNGTPRNRIIRLNTDGTIDNTFNVGTGFDFAVLAIDIQSDGKLIIGGNFTSYNGTPRNSIVRLNTDGTIDNTFNVGTGFNIGVYAIDIQSDGKLIIGGDFTSYNSQTTNRFAFIDNVGSRINVIKNEFSIIINDKLANYGGNYHDFYDDRTLVDKEYVDIEVFDSINDNFQLSGATNGMALVFNSGTTKYQPSFVDYNTLLNLPTPTTYGNIAFVSPNGNNSTAVIGRFDRPYATIQQAINTSPANGSVCIVEGTYNESLSINKQLKFSSVGRVQINGTHTVTSATVEFDNIRLKQASVAAIFTATSSTITLKNLETDTAGSFVASATGTSTIIARNVYSNKNLTNGTFTNERPFNFVVDETFSI